MAVKEIESALGNKTMNDASKKRLSYWGWEWEWGGGGGGGGGLLKRNFIKRGEKGDGQQKRNGGLPQMAVRGREDGTRGQYVRL